MLMQLPMLLLLLLPLAWDGLLLQAAARAGRLQITARPQLLLLALLLALPH
jgi:hypothetical protein